MQAAKKIFFNAFFASFLFLNLLATPAQASLWDSQTGMDDSIANAYGTTEESTDIRIFVANLIKVFLGLLGLIFLILIIVAGYNYMTAQGNQEKIEKSVGQIKAAIIGLVIIIAAFSIASFVTEEIFDAVNKYG